MSVFLQYFILDKSICPRDCGCRSKIRAPEAGIELKTSHNIECADICAEVASGWKKRNCLLACIQVGGSGEEGLPFVFTKNRFAHLVLVLVDRCLFSSLVWVFQTGNKILKNYDISLFRMYQGPRCFYVTRYLSRIYQSPRWCCRQGDSLKRLSVFVQNFMCKATRFPLNWRYGTATEPNIATLSIHSYLLFLEFITTCARDLQELVFMLSFGLDFLVVIQLLNRCFNNPFPEKSPLGSLVVPIRIPVDYVNNFELSVCIAWSLK